VNAVWNKASSRSSIFTRSMRLNHSIAVMVDSELSINYNQGAMCSLGVSHIDRSDRANASPGIGQGRVGGESYMGLLPSTQLTPNADSLCCPSNRLVTNTFQVRPACCEGILINRRHYTRRQAHSNGHNAFYIRPPTAHGIGRCKAHYHSCRLSSVAFVCLTTIRHVM
jgi:hypothetical protein